jgi:hypothetical protein
MARCLRCNGCRSQWDMEPCPYCNYPKPDTRTPEQKIQDEKDWEDYNNEG